MKTGMRGGPLVADGVGGMNEADRKTIHIALAADANYVMPLSVAICSTAANCDRQRRLVFHVLHSGIDADLRARVVRSLERTGFPDAGIHWISVDIDHIADLQVTNSHVTLLTYARLLIPCLLPSTIMKVLYLDADVVVRGDVAELWDSQLGSKALLAVRDLMACVSAPRGVANFRELGIPEDAKYFNAGVLLINLVKWREHDVASRVFDYVRRYRATVTMEDQEGLNAVLFDDWGELPFRWNWQVPWRMYRTGRRIMPWNPRESTQSIIHFTTSEKPWLPGCDVEEREVFLEYLDRTEWAGWRVPLVDEIAGRSRRVVGDVRAWAGRWRRRAFELARG